MKRRIVSALAALLASLILTYAFVQGAHAAELPQQAQASTLAVPEQAPVYASAVLVVRCRLVEALILIDDKGEQHPYHGKDSTLANILTVLSAVPADKVTQVTLSCPTESQT